MAIDLTDVENNLGGFSDDPVALSDVDLLPFLLVSSVWGISPLLGLYFAVSCSVVTLPVDLQCITICDLPRLQRTVSSVDFLHFQHLCCVHHVEVPAGESMICSAPRSTASSFSVFCCGQREHFECLARSVHSCGDRCPFCTQPRPHPV